MPDKPRFTIPWRPGTVAVTIHAQVGDGELIALGHANGSTRAELNADIALLLRTLAEDWPRG